VGADAALSTARPPGLGPGVVPRGAGRLCRRRLDDKPDLAHVTACGPRQAQLDGFDLHANVWVPPTDRVRLAHLCRDLLPPPLPRDRVTLRSGFRPTNGADRAEVLSIILIRVWETERVASCLTWFFRGAPAWVLRLRLRHTPPVSGTGISTLCGLLGLRGRVVMRSCVDICSHSCEHPTHPRVIVSHVLGGVLRVWAQGHAHPLVARQLFPPIDAPPQHLDRIGEAGLHHGPR
jgi:hypothetical protein